MVKHWPQKIAAAIISGCLLVSVFGTHPAGAMIFPDLLKLVRVDKPGSGKNDFDVASGKASPQEQPVKKETYVVKAGDTLWAISRKYNVDWKEIAECNNIGVNQVIHSGQVLEIPVEGNVFHVVRSGDSLWEIARKYDQDVDSIAAANGITDPSQLQVGKRLIIPEAEGVPVIAGGRNELPSRGKGLWKWPVLGPITQRYGQNSRGFHHGMDIAAETGEKIYPVRPGKVEFSGWLNHIYGRAVIVDHGNGVRTLYAHNSKNLVTKGEHVDTSRPIAKIGNTGKTTGPHLHLEVHVGDQTVDPQVYLTSL